MMAAGKDLCFPFGLQTVFICTPDIFLRRVTFDKRQRQKRHNRHSAYWSSFIPAPLYLFCTTKSLQPTSTFVLLCVLADEPPSKGVPGVGRRLRGGTLPARPGGPSLPPRAGVRGAWDVIMSHRQDGAQVPTGGEGNQFCNAEN